MHNDLINFGYIKRISSNTYFNDLWPSDTVFAYEDLKFSDEEIRIKSERIFTKINRAFLRRNFNILSALKFLRKRKHIDRYTRCHDKNNNPLFHIYCKLFTFGLSVDINKIILVRREEIIDNILN